MKKHQQERDEVNRAWNQLEPREIDALRADMQEKTQLRMNGRLQSRFHQVMLDRNILKLDTYGDHIMMNPFEYIKMQKAEAKIAKSDRDEMERMFEAFPEERTAYLQKVKVWADEIRKSIRGVTKATRV